MPRSPPPPALDKTRIPLRPAPGAVRPELPPVVPFERWDTLSPANFVSRKAKAFLPPQNRVSYRFPALHDVLHRSSSRFHTG